MYDSDHFRLNFIGGFLDVWAIAGRMSLFLLIF